MAVPLRVLVVDDNHLIVRLLHAILEGAGYVPVGALSEEEALEYALGHPPDVCIVDEVMPGTAGSELIRTLRANADPRLANVPVIGISARPGAWRDLLGAGANVFVPKPIEETTILDALSRALEAAPPAPPGKSAV
jgi:CheY-like chemotaxis protein